MAHFFTNEASRERQSLDRIDERTLVQVVVSASAPIADVGLHVELSLLSTLFDCVAVCLAYIFYRRDSFSFGPCSSPASSGESPLSS